MYMDDLIQNYIDRPIMGKDGEETTLYKLFQKIKDEAKREAIENARIVVHKNALKGHGIHAKTWVTIDKELASLKEGE